MNSCRREFYTCSLYCHDLHTIAYVAIVKDTLITAYVVQVKVNGGSWASEAGENRVRTSTSPTSTHYCSCSLVEASWGLGCV